MRTRVLNTDHQKNVSVGLLLATALAVNLFFLTPISLYLGNSEEFITPLQQLLGWWALPALGTLLVLMVLGMACSRKLYQRYLVLLASLNLLIWFQSNVLVWDYGLLDGRNISSGHHWRGKAG